MRSEQGDLLRAADRAQEVPTELKNAIIELPAVALCNEIKHHFATGAIDLQAPRNVDLAMDALS